MFYKRFVHFNRSEKGQGMIEYGLILALVSIVSVGALSGVGSKITDTYNMVADSGGDVGVVGPDEPEIIFTEKFYSGEQVDEMVKQGYIPVSSAKDLENIANGVMHNFGTGTDWSGEYESGLDKNYILVADIDLGEIADFKPIGLDKSNPFKGIFDGGGYEIYNLSINRSDVGVGLFGVTSNATIKNIGLVNGSVKGNEFVGAIVGELNEGSELTNSYAEGVNVSGPYGGGLVGSVARVGVIKNSYATGEVVSRGIAGGVLGMDNTSSVHMENCYATGLVSVPGDSGSGLIGFLGMRGTVIRSGWANDVNIKGYHTSKDNMPDIVGRPKVEIDLIIKELIQRKF